MKGNLNLDNYHWAHPYVKTLTPFAKLAFFYIHDQLAEGRWYISTERMAALTGIPENNCEAYIAKFHVDRVIPRLHVLEEAEE